MRVNQSGHGSIQGNEIGPKGGPRTQGPKDVGGAAEHTEGIGKHSHDEGVAPKHGTEGGTAEISPKARESAQAKVVAQQTPDVREEKIAELKKRIADGSYKVDTHAVADRMVDEHLSSQHG